METEKRLTLNDPEEWAIVKSIYFDNDLLRDQDIDQIECLERQESKSKNLNYNSR